MKDVIKQSIAARGTINPHYSMLAKEAEEIAQKSGGLFEVIGNSFAYGYLQGQRAERASLKKQSSTKRKSG